MLPIQNNSEAQTAGGQWSALTLIEEYGEDVRSQGADIFVGMSELSILGRVRGRVGAVRDMLSREGIDENTLLVQSVGKSSLAWIPIPLVLIAVPVGLLAQAKVTLMLGIPILLIGVSILMAFLRVETFSAELCLQCPDPQTVDRALVKMLGFSGLSVRSIAWRYKSADDARTEWVKAAIASAQKRAARLAAAMDMRICGIHSCEETWRLPSDGGGPAANIGASAIPAKRRAMGSDLAPNLGGSARASVQVYLTFRMAPANSNEDTKP